jgi:undecaprenyl-diphosphatase
VSAPPRRWPAIRREFGWLAGFLAVTAALLAFFGLAGEVLEGETLGFDRLILLALRSPVEPYDPIGPRWLVALARDVTGLGGIPVLTGVTLAVAGYLTLARKRAAALLILSAVGGGVALSTLLKLTYHRARPDLVPHGVDVYTASFPSGHAMLSAVTYLTLGALLARVETRWSMKAYILTLAVLVTLLVGISRVYLGVHWPTDVLAGWCVGAAWAIVCWLIALWLQHKGKITRADNG